jgi:hypothetical protein
MSDTLERGPYIAIDDQEADDAAHDAPGAGFGLLEGDTAFTLHLRWFVALCAAAAGIAHFLWAFPHIDHHIVLGEAFMAAGVLQVAWAAWIVRAPNRPLLAAGGALALASIIVWVFAHSTGISWFPGLEVAEIIGWGDTVTKWFELAVVLGVVALLLPASVHRPAERGALNASVLALMIVAIGAVLAITYIGAYEPAHAPAGDHTHGPAEMDDAHDL